MAALRLDVCTAPFTCLDWRDFTAEENSLVRSRHDISVSITGKLKSEGGGGVCATNVCPVLF